MGRAGGSPESRLRTRLVLPLEAMDLAFVPASRLTVVDLVAVWNRAYDAYAIPFVVDEGALAAHFLRSDVDLARSVVGTSGGEAIAVSVAALRGRRAWIGGFGVGAAWRRRGIARRLLDHHLARLDPDADTVDLEVLEDNPARSLYRQAGFAETTALVSVEGVPARVTHPAPLVEVGFEDMCILHKNLGCAPATWRREPPSLSHAIRTGARVLALGTSACAVVRPGPEKILVADATASDVASAAALFGALRERFGTTPLRLVDEREGSPIDRAARDAGLAETHRQWAMRRRGDAPAP